MKSIDLKQLRYFVDIVDAGSITRAAQILNIAQPALTNRMSALEANLGVKILSRSSHGVLPTEEGEVLYRSAKRILSDLETVAEEVRALGRTPTGAVRFACTSSSARLLTRSLTDQVLRQLPHVRFSLIAGTSLDTYQRIQKVDADLAFLFQDGDIPGVTGEPLIMEEQFVIVSGQAKEFFGKNEISLEEVSRLNFVMASAAKHFGTEFLHRRFAEVSIKLKVITEIHSLTDVIEMVIENKAAAILPWTAVHRFEESGQIRLLRVRDVDLTRQLTLCRPSDRPLTPAVAAVARIVADLATSLVESGAWRFARICGERTTSLISRRGCR